MGEMPLASSNTSALADGDRREHGAQHPEAPVDATERAACGSARRRRRGRRPAAGGRADVGRSTRPATACGAGCQRRRIGQHHRRVGSARPRASRPCAGSAGSAVASVKARPATSITRWSCSSRIADTKPGAASAEAESATDSGTRPSTRRPNSSSNVRMTTWRSGRMPVGDERHVDVAHVVVRGQDQRTRPLDAGLAQDRRVARIAVHHARRDRARQAPGSAARRPAARWPRRARPAARAPRASGSTGPRGRTG